MPKDTVVNSDQEVLWAPFWRADLFDYHYLLPYEREVWDVVHASWRIDLSKTFGKKLPIGFIGSKDEPYLMFPSQVAFHTGIAPPDKLETETPGEEFMKALTQLRVPIMYLHKQLPLALLRWVMSTLSGPIPVKGFARDLFQLMEERRLTFFIPTIYADADTASKYLTILDWCKTWEDVIGHKVNIHTSKIVCFHADQGIEDTLQRETQILGFEALPAKEKFVWEFNPKKDYYKIRDRYGFYPTESQMPEENVFKEWLEEL